MPVSEKLYAPNRVLTLLAGGGNCGNSEGSMGQSCRKAANSAFEAAL
jgi:hypothetical protein